MVWKGREGRGGGGSGGCERRISGMRLVWLELSESYSELKWPGLHLSARASTSSRRAPSLDLASSHPKHLSTWALRRYLILLSALSSPFPPCHLVTCVSSIASLACPECLISRTHCDEASDCQGPKLNPSPFTPPFTSLAFRSSGFLLTFAPPTLQPSLLPTPDIR